MVAENGGVSGGGDRHPRRLGGGFVGAAAAAAAAVVAPGNPLAEVGGVRESKRGLCMLLVLSKRGRGGGEKKEKPARSKVKVGGERNNT